MKKAGIRVVVLIMAIFLSGCASAKHKFKLSEGTYAKDTIKQWPKEREIPRYRFEGEITGENNFIVVEEEKNFFESALKFIAGVLTGGPRDPDILQRPQSGVTGDDGTIYITDVSRQAVWVFDTVNGKMSIWDEAMRNLRFIDPIGVALGPDENEIYVADSSLGMVAVLDRTGQPLRTIGKGKLDRPTGIAIDHNTGNIYVADTHAHNIKVFDSTGAIKQIIGKRGTGDGEFNFPVHLSFKNGKLYVSDGMNARVQVFSPDGSHLLNFGKLGLYVGNLTHPKGVASDSDGNVYVIEAYYDHMLVFDSDGNFLMPIGGTGFSPGKFYLPTGIWVDKNDTIYVADMFNRRIAIFQYLGGN